MVPSEDRPHLGEEIVAMGRAGDEVREWSHADTASFVCAVHVPHLSQAPTRPASGDNARIRMSVRCVRLMLVA